MAGLKPYYQDGAVTIYHGDCRAVLPLLGAGIAHLVCTDPPYGVEFQSNRRAEKFDLIAGDDDVNWLGPVWQQVAAAQVADSLLISFYGWQQAHVFWPHWLAAGYRMVSHLVFIKNVWGLGWFSRGQHEVAMLMAKGKPKPPEDAPSDVWPWDRVQGHEHPTEKPVGALTGPIDVYCPPGGLVLDPFMGSGSTLRAAKDTRRRAIGIEIEERYCEVAARRMAQEVLPF